MKEQTAVEFIISRLKIMEAIDVRDVEKAKEMEEEQKKQLVIGTYIDLKMKNNNLPFGMEYISKLGKLEEEAEQYYNKTFKQ
jgi:hypothetical protein